MVETDATNHAHAAHGQTLVHSVACDHRWLLLSCDSTIIRQDGEKSYRKGVQTSLALGKSFWQKICQVSALSRTLSHKVVNRQHEAESQKQCRCAAAVTLRCRNHILADDIEHSAPCEGEDEGQRGGGEIDSTET